MRSSRCSLLGGKQNDTCGPKSRTGSLRTHCGIWDLHRQLLTRRCPIRPDNDRNFAAIGDTTNVATMLQSEAKAGEIVLGPETARLVDGSLPLTALGPVRVKGRSQPVQAFTTRAE